MLLKRTRNFVKVSKKQKSNKKRKKGIKALKEKTKMSLREMEKQFKRAEHLFYTSLKYTKTGDVIVNILKRWCEMIEASIEAILEKAKKKKQIKEIPKAPLKKRLAVLKLFPDEPLVKQVMDLYLIFRNVDKYRKIAEHEFRKNLTLHIFTEKDKLSINFDKINEWHELIQAYLKFVKSYAK